MGDALNALRPQRLRTKAASSLLPHWLDGYSECNSCSSRVLLAHVESANCPVAYQGLKITTSLSSVSMIFSEGIISLHHETIYQHILADKKAGGELYKHLRHQNKTYRKRYGSAHNRTGIPNRVDIDERPEEVNNRKRIGDWEADTIIGKNHKGAIVTLDERVSKLRLTFPLAGKKAQYVLDATILMLDPIKSFVKTITFDNGKEFTLHEKIAEALGCDTYFATPYSSWERGQNENANGLLRQYFPKVMELIDVTIKEVFIAVDKLNSRPKKCLNYKTPYEVFEELTGIDMKNLLGYVLMT
nr:IS30 family transposase [Bathymodiolus japonicus methanotrophic gill symbiont]